MATARRAEQEERTQKIEDARFRMAANRAARAYQPEPAPRDPVRPQPAEKQVLARCSGKVKGEKLIHVKTDKATGIKIGKAKSAMVPCPKHSTVTFEVTNPGSGKTHLCHFCEEHAASMRPSGPPPYRGGSYEEFKAKYIVEVTTAPPTSRP